MATAQSQAQEKTLEDLFYDTLKDIYCRMRDCERTEESTLQTQCRSLSALRQVLSEMVR